MRAALFHGVIMAAELLTDASRATDSNSNPYAGATWSFYATGTLTPQAVYADAGLAVSLGSVVTADAGGKFVPIYFDAALLYRGVLKSAGGAVTIYDIDPVNTGVISQLSAPGGSYAIGFSHDAASLPGTVGDRLSRDIYVTDAPWNAKCDFESGNTNDLAAILACIDDAPVGARIIIPGPLYITDTLTITKRVDIICPDDKSAIIVNVGTGKDGVVFGPGTGTGDALHRVTLKLNVYGAANSCRNGVVFHRVDRSNIDVNVSVGTIQTKNGLVDDEGFGAVFYGCLQDSDAVVQSSVNFRPPYATLTAAFQKDHVLIKKDTGRGISTQAGSMTVNFEGGGHGLVTRAAPGEGLATYYGTIQGLSGHPVYMVTQTGVTLDGLWLEQNTLPPKAIDCKYMTVRQCQLTAPTQAAATFNFENCLRPEVSLIYGEVSFDANCVAPLDHGTFSQFPREMAATGTSFFDSAERDRPGYAIDISSISYGGEGMSTLRNLFSNPFVDLWPGGNSVYTIPGIAGGVTNAVLDRETNSVFPQGVGSECKVTIGTAGATKGALLTLDGANGAWTGRDRWVSFMLWVRLRSSNAAGKNLRIMVGAADNVAGMTQFCDVEDRTVFAVRGGFGVAAGKVPAILCTMHDGSNYVTGVFDIGGVSMVNGPRAPKYIEDSLERHAPVGSITATPAYLWQKALVGADAYIAVGTSSSADWKKATP